MSRGPFTQAKLLLLGTICHQNYSAGVPGLATQGTFTNAGQRGGKSLRPMAGH